MTQADPRVGVVVITRDRALELLRCVDRLKQTEARCIVVVDNGSTDGSVHRLRGRHHDVDVVSLPGNLGGAGRNIGVARCHTPYVAFCDDDSAWEPGSLSAAAELLDAAPELGLLSARLLLADGREDPLCGELASSPLGEGRVGPRILGFAACAAVVRRSAFLQAGGFHPALGVGGEEDVLAMDLATRGWTLEYAPRLTAHHLPSRRRDERGRRRRVLRNRLLTVWMRRPRQVAAGLSARAILAARHDPAAMLGVLDALGDAGVVRRARSVVPESVERALQLLADGRAAPGSTLRQRRAARLPVAR